MWKALNVEITRFMHKLGNASRAYAKSRPRASYDTVMNVGSLVFMVVVLLVVSVGTTNTRVGETSANSCAYTAQ